MQTDLLKKVIVSAGMVGSNAVIALVISIVLARTMGAQQFGLYSFYLTLVTILSVPMQAGLPPLVVREVAQSKARQEWGTILGIKQISERLIFMLGAVILVGVLLFSKATDYDWQSDHGRIFSASLLLLPCIAFSAARGALVRGLGRVILGQLPEQIMKPVLLLALILGLYGLGELSPLTAMGANLCAAVAALTVGVWIQRMSLKKLLPVGASANRPALGNWMLALLPFSMLYGFQIINTQADVILLGLLSDPAEVGVYKVASQFSQLINLIIIAVGIVVSPKVAELFVGGEREKLSALVGRASLVSVALSIPLFILFIFAGRQVIGGLYGGEYGMAYICLMILSVGQFFAVVGSASGLVLNMGGCQWLTAAGVVGAVVINLSMGLLLVPRLGATGSAVSASCALCFSAVFLSVCSIKVLRINPTFLKLHYKNYRI